MIKDKLEEIEMARKIPNGFADPEVFVPDVTVPVEFMVKEHVDWLINEVKKARGEVELNKNSNLEGGSIGSVVQDKETNELMEELKHILSNTKYIESSTFGNKAELDLDEFHWLLDKMREMDNELSKLKNFKDSVEYTVDSITLETIIDNQSSDNKVLYSETYNEKVYELQEKIKGLEKDVKEWGVVNESWVIVNEEFVKDKIETKQKYEEYLKMIKDNADDKEAVIGLVEELLDE